MTFCLSGEKDAISSLFNLINFDLLALAQAFKLESQEKHSSVILQLTETKSIIKKRNL